jgi:hypothetical protein
MSGVEFLLAWYSLGVGVSLIGFWSWVVATGRAGRMGRTRVDFGWHIAAELVAGVLTLIAGLGLVFARNASWPLVMTAVGIGAVIYAVTESAGHYLATGQRMMAAAVALGWVFTIPALVLVFFA